MNENPAAVTEQISAAGFQTDSSMSAIPFNFFLKQNEGGRGNNNKEALWHVAVGSYGS